MSYSVLFVCMGNICRSPTVHGVMRQQLRNVGLEHRVRIDSAATHNYHPGEAPDPRSQHHMDHNNLQHLLEQAPAKHRHKVRLLAEFFEEHDAPVVPDPYYSGADGFEHVLDLAEDGCRGLIRHLQGVLAR